SCVTHRAPPGSALFPYTTLFRSREAVTIDRWHKHGVDRKRLEPWPRPEAIPARPRDRRGAFLFLQVAYAGGVWETTKELVRELRSEEHTSELQSRVDLVCRLLLE